MLRVQFERGTGDKFSRPTLKSVAGIAHLVSQERGINASSS